MNKIQYKRSTRGCQTRKRAELKDATSLTETNNNILESSYKTQLDLAVKGVLYENLYPLSCKEIVDRLTWLMPDHNSSEINWVFASLQRLVMNKLVSVTRIVEQENVVTKYLLNLPYDYLQQERAARVRITTQMDWRRHNDR